MTKRHPLDLPDHHCVDDIRERGERWSDSDRIDALSQVLRNVPQSCDFILIDTPGGGSALNLFSHGLADTLITPVNDSFLDLDVIYSMGPTPETMLKPIALRGNRHPRLRGAARDQPAGARLDCRAQSDLTARVAQRAQRGRGARQAGARRPVQDDQRPGGTGGLSRVLPARVHDVDSFETSLLGVKPSMSHVLARLEVRQLITALGLPLAAAEAQDPSGGVAGPEFSSMDGDLRNSVARTRGQYVKWRRKGHMNMEERQRDFSIYASAAEADPAATGLDLVERTAELIRATEEHAAEMVARAAAAVSTHAGRRCGSRSAFSRRPRRDGASPKRS